MAIVLLASLFSGGATVEGALNHNILAGSVADPPTKNILPADLRLKSPVGGCANPVNGDLFICDYDEQVNPSTAFNRVFKIENGTDIITIRLLRLSAILLVVDYPHPKMFKLQQQGKYFLLLLLDMK